MSKTPTGKIRYRAHNPVFGKQLIVLQIEKTVADAGGDGMGVSRPTYTTWEDATLEDITEAKKCGT